MIYRAKVYKEWDVEETQSSVTKARIQDNEAVIDWLYAGRPQLGQAASIDGVNFKGAYKEPGRADGDRGTFEFRLYKVPEGLVLLGSWNSEVYAEEKEFLLLLEAST